MSIVQVNPTTNSLSDTITAQNKAYKTQADITLTNFSGTGVPAVQSGSIFANNGTLFEVDANAAINDSGVANGWVYVKYNVSNARFEYNVTSPTWSDTKQGYYVSNDRYFYKMYKVGAGEFRYKLKLKLNYNIGEPFANGYYKSFSAQTENTIFDDLTYAVASTGDFVNAEGWFEAGVSHVGGIYKSSTAIVRFVAGDAGFNITDGSTVARTIEIDVKGFLL